MEAPSSLDLSDRDISMRTDTLAGPLPRILAHDVPRFGGSTAVPLVAEPEDAPALRRIVEAQARDLVTLRRALGAAHRIAAQRLQMLRGVSPVVADQSSFPLADASRPQADIAAALREDILRVQEDIRVITEFSRWRRLGQSLGVAKHLPWEAGDWRTKLLPIPGAAPAAQDGSRAEPMLSELRTELRRLSGLREELGRSRWRRFGQRLGLAKRMPWELGVIAPAVAPHVPGPIVSAPNLAVPTGPSASSYEGFLEHTSRRFLEECQGFATDVVLDVGANIGQFAKGLRTHGYHGQIVSFEPLSAAHKTLAAAAKDDPLWDVVDRCAVGAANGSAEINIAGNSASSSLLPMLDRHRDAAPHSAYAGSERCPVITLDTFIDHSFADPTTQFGLKIDTQGFEAEVLAGLIRNRERVKVVLCEMSLAPLYAGGPTMSELCRLLADFGYRCVALGPEFEDPRTGELLQADGVFVRRE